MGHGRAIINIDNQSEQLEIYETILTNKLSVRQTEHLVKNYKVTTEIVKPVKEELPKFVKKGIKEFSEYFGHEISVKVSKNGRGSITIPFDSEKDFNRLKKLVKRAK